MWWWFALRPSAKSLNESPSEKEGKSALAAFSGPCRKASMKVPPKRKGNRKWVPREARRNSGLNESPSEKEGK